MASPLCRAACTALRRRWRRWRADGQGSWNSRVCWSADWGWASHLATLDVLPPGAKVVVVDIVPEVVEWNRGPLGPLAGNPLQDPRVQIEINDVAITLSSRPGQFDAVLLDVDNGPAAFTSSSNNAGLYDDRGIAVAFAALRMDGVLAVWSARGDRKFEQRMRHGRFDVELQSVRGRLKGGGPRHTIFLGHKSSKR